MSAPPHSRALCQKILGGSLETQNPVRLPAGTHALPGPSVCPSIHPTVLQLLRRPLPVALVPLSPHGNKGLGVPEGQAVPHSCMCQSPGTPGVLPSPGTRVLPCPGTAARTSLLWQDLETGPGPAPQFGTPLSLQFPSKPRRGQEGGQRGRPGPHPSSHVVGIRHACSLSGPLRGCPSSIYQESGFELQGPILCSPWLHLPWTGPSGKCRVRSVWPRFGQTRPNLGAQMGSGNL